MFNPINEIDLIQVGLLRALASPQRLRIVHLLGGRSCDVTELAHELGLVQATASQHLAAMRAVGLVEAVRDGRCVRYQLSDPEILQACNAMRDVIVRRLSNLGSLAAAAGRTSADAGPDRAAVRTPTSSQVTRHD